MKFQEFLRTPVATMSGALLTSVIFVTCYRVFWQPRAQKTRRIEAEAHANFVFENSLQQKK